MNKLVRSLLLVVCCVSLSAVCFAQENKPEMADVMRSNGKIYVVVAVCLTILIGLFLYIVLIDKKVNRLEKRKD